MYHFCILVRLHVALVLHQVDVNNYSWSVFIEFLCCPWIVQGTFSTRVFVAHFKFCVDANGWLFCVIYRSFLSILTTTLNKIIITLDVVFTGCGVHFSSSILVFICTTAINVSTIAMPNKFLHCVLYVGTNCWNAGKNLIKRLIVMVEII